MTSPSIPGQPHIHYADGQLQVEGCSLDGLATEFGTPLFVYSKASMLAALAAYQRGFSGRNAQICYAMKANSSLGVLQVFAQAGCGFDIVSAGELARVITAGADASKVIFSGVGKTRTEMRQALEAGIGCFNVESEAEIDVLNAVAVSMGKCAPISIRVNPNVDPKTHPYISTGLKQNKFGIAAAVAADPAFASCMVNRIWNWGMSRPDVIDDGATLTTDLASKLTTELMGNNWNLKKSVRSVFTSDSFVSF